MATARVYTGFLPAGKLNLSGEEKRAAISVLRDMESGKIIDMDEEPPALGQGFRFDMSTVHEPGEQCGSVCCLAGWMSVKLDPKKHSNHHYGYYLSLYPRSEALNRLTSAESEDGSGSWMLEAKVKHGARALRNFLTTGKANWRKAMGKDA